MYILADYFLNANIFMKLNFTLFFVFLIGLNVSFGQRMLQVDKDAKSQKIFPLKQITRINNPLARPVIGKQKCGFANMLKRATAKGYNEVAYETELKKLVQKRIALGQTAFTGIVTIPIIFHVVYNTGDALSATSPNLTSTMFQAQLDQLNKDYANLSGSTYGVATDVRVRFCFAVTDTTGKLLAEPGIDRLNGTAKGWAATDGLSDVDLQTEFDGTIKPASIWDPYSYFNVWTAAMTTSGLLGYATFPSISTLPGLDNTEDDATAGVVIAWETVGSSAKPGNDPNYGYGRTLTHESGHFLGLRHIWGDANCGEDYCADTPPQDVETTGCPSAGTLNNCTPSMPKMFENYMDYTDDGCVNTFTANQASRCQASMDNSPRRVSLINSKACQARVANAVQFASATPFAVAETGNAGSCPNTKSYSFNIYVASKASGAATLTFTIAGGTAIQNVDYTISPATVSYTANDNAVKKITLTILDDQLVEPTETIQIGYTISGTGVIAGPDKQVLTVSIADDDVAMATINNITPIKSLLNENFNASAAIPTGWSTEFYDDGVGGYVPNQWVVSANGGIGTSGNAAHITKTISTKPNTYTNTKIADAYLITPLLDATGVRNINLSFKWRCMGEVGYDEGYIGYIPEGQAATAANVLYFNAAYSGLTAGTTAATENVDLPLELSNTKFRLVFNWYNDDVTGGNPPFTIDNVLVTGTYLSVASTVDADTAFSQYSGQTVAYYSTTGASPAIDRVIATIANPGQDLGCITANIQSAGAGKTVLSTASGSYFRTNKVIKLTPAVANSSVTYQATLYFTTAELSPAWTAAEIPALKILKVKDGVNLAGILTADEAQLITPTFVDNATAKGYYTYTGSFTGFSQFMLVSPTVVLPVTLLSFDVMAKKSAIALSWITGLELNNKGFQLERSTNGIDFEKMGWVNGKSNSNIQTTYAYSDNFVQPNTLYYYRLRQVNEDGKEILSAIKQARIAKAAITVAISPVPAKDYINLFISGTNKPAAISLINLQGQLVKSWEKVSTFNSFYKLNTSGLTAGVYSLVIILPEEKLVKKILIER
jgi:hypothetical protein